MAADTLVARPRRAWTWFCLFPVAMGLLTVSRDVAGADIDDVTAGAAVVFGAFFGFCALLHWRVRVVVSPTGITQQGLLGWHVRWADVVSLVGDDGGKLHIHHRSPGTARQVVKRTVYRPGFSREDWRVIVARCSATYTRAMALAQERAAPSPPAVPRAT